MSHNNEGTLPRRSSSPKDIQSHGSRGISESSFTSTPSNANLSDYPETDIDAGTMNRKHSIGLSSCEGAEGGDTRALFLLSEDEDVNESPKENTKTHNFFEETENPPTPIKERHLSAAAIEAGKYSTSTDNTRNRFSFGGDSTDSDSPAMQRRYSITTSSSFPPKDNRGSTKETRKKYKSGSDEVDGGLFKTKSKSAAILSKLEHKIRKSFLGNKDKRSQTTPDFVGESSRLSYMNRICEYERNGKGYILVIANFTNDLLGYQKDISDLKKFFQVTLGYEYRQYCDCTQERMFSAIDEAKQDIRRLTNEGTKITKLVVCILSHGDADGIYTCEDDAGVLKEMAEGKYKVTNLEDILAKFDHSEMNLPMLKDCPKFFVIQACHGEEIARAAGNKSSLPSLLKSRGPDMCNYQPNIKIPLETDVLVLAAATKNKQSFVLDVSGSWLIQDMLDVFRGMHQHHEVESMLKSVTGTVSLRRKAITLEDENKETVQDVAIQVPMRQSTLRKAFYLS